MKKIYVFIFLAVLCSVFFGCNRNEGGETKEEASSFVNAENVTSGSFVTNETTGSLATEELRETTSVTHICKTEDRKTLYARVIEINGSLMTVIDEKTKGRYRFDYTDCENMNDSADFSQGDEVIIEYEGPVRETFPLEISSLISISYADNREKDKIVLKKYEGKTEAILSRESAEWLGILIERADKKELWDYSYDDIPDYIFIFNENQTYKYTVNGRIFTDCNKDLAIILSEEDGRKMDEIIIKESENK